MKKIIAIIGLAAATVAGAQADSFTSTSATTAWNAGRWNNTTDAAPYTSTYTANNDVSFTSGSYSFAGMGAVLNVGNVTLSNNVNVIFATTGSTYATGGLVRTFNLGTGATFNFNGQAISTAAGTGFNKTGAGTLIMGAGSTFAGGFTLGAGTVVAGGVNALGSGGALNLNGGILTVSSGTARDFTGKYTSGISVGGDVQFGDSVNQAAGTGNMTFSNTMALGSANRTLTLGYGGTVVFGGVISNTGSNGVTFAATAGGTGRFDVTNTANTFTGPINITGGEVRFTDANSFGNANNTIIVDGGRLATANSASFTLASTHAIQLGATAGTAISAPGTGVLTYNGALSDKTASTGILVKQGGGTLSLGGVSTYTGATSINNGILLLTTGNDRLPTGTVVSIGQSASANLGTFDLNGRNQQIAGLSSTTGTNATASNNTVTSVSAATLTINGGGSYGDGTDANSGVITGAISIVKTGAGTQTFGDVNTYTGTTTISGGTLVGANNKALGDTSSLSVSAGTFDIRGTTVGTVTLGTAANFSLSGTGTIALQLGTAFDQLVSNSTGAFTISGGTFSLDVTGVGFSYTNSYAVLSGFGGTNSVSGLSFTGYDNTNYSAALSTLGVVSFTAVPEPSTFGLAILGGVGMLVFIRRRRSALI